MNLLRGLIEVTGEIGTGKTSFALECGVQPEEIGFFDDDVKGRATVEEFRERYQAEGRDFGGYFDLVALRRGKTLIEFHQICQDLIEREVIPGRFRVLIWDTWTRFSKTCRHYVNRNQAKFRKPGPFSKGGGWSDHRGMKGAEINQEGTLHEAEILGDLLTRVDTLFVVAHLKTKYVNNQPTEAETPAVGGAVIRLARMRVWTRHNPRGDGVPVGLLLKRPSWKIITDRGLRTVNPLPRKLTPNVRLVDGEEPNDESLWDTIARYTEHPIGNRQPLAEETPNTFELGILNDTLTADQKVNLRLALRVAAGEAASESKTATVVSPPAVVDRATVTRIKSLKADGKALPVIASEVGISVAEVARTLREAK